MNSLTNITSATSRVDNVRLYVIIRVLNNVENDPTQQQ